MDDTLLNQVRPLELRVRIAGGEGGFAGITEHDARRWGRVSADFGLIVRGLNIEDGAVLSVALLEPSGVSATMTTDRLMLLLISLMGFVARRDLVGADMEAAQRQRDLVAAFLGMMGLTPELGPIGGVIPVPDDASPPASPDAPPPPAGEEVPSTG